MRAGALRAAAPAEPVAETLTARTVRIADLDAALLDQWQALEDRALEPNPFLSPLLVLPSVRHLRPRSDVFVLLIEGAGPGPETLAGLGVFERVARTTLLPYPHVKGYETSNTTFLTGLLVDRTRAPAVTDAVFEFLEGQPAAWHHLEFTRRTAGSDLDRYLSASAARFGRTWHGESFERAVLVPSDPALADVEACLSSRRRKNVRRGFRTLQTRGGVELRVSRGSDISSRQLDAFLALEHTGWKREGGTSLLSKPHSEAFFREMAAAFVAARRMILAELLVGGEVVGSTTTLMAGRSAVAFKTGWHPDYVDVGLGVLQEVEFARQAPTLLADLESIDGGTAEDSWLLSVWPGRRRITTGLFLGSRTASTAYTLTRRLSAVKQSVQGFL